MKLRKLTIQALRSIENAELTFPDNGLLLIRGINHDTGGSSGAGKSNLISAIAYALDICPVSATSLQSWKNEKALKVSLTLDGNRSIEITRGSEARIQVDGVLATGAKAVKEKLPSATGLTSDLLSALTYRPQKRRSLFLSMPDADKKEFLAAALDLTALEKAADAANEKAKTLLQGLKYQEGVLAAAEASVAAITVPEQPVKPEEMDIGELRRLEAIRQQITLESEQARTLESNRITTHIVAPWDVGQEVATKKALAALEKCNEHLMKLMKNDYLRKAEEEEANSKALADYNRSVRDCKIQIVNLSKEISLLENNNCFTCHQQWEGAAAALENNKTLLKGVQERLGSLAAPVMVPFTPDPNVVAFSTLYITLQAAYETEATSLAIRRKAFDDRQRKDATARMVELAALNQRYESLIVARWAEYEPVYEDLLTQRTIAEKAANEYERLYAMYVQADATATRFKIARDKASQDVADTTVALRAESDFASLIGREGFLGSIFDEVLQEISQKVNKMLIRVPNVAHVTFRFRSEALTGKGTIKKTISPIITVDGVTTSMADGLSGGQETSVDLAVDLAISSVVASRTGTAPGFLILDEAFEGLGVKEKEGWLEVLAEEAVDKLIMVVDHSSETKEQFSQVIDVHFERGISTVII